MAGGLMRGERAPAAGGSTRMPACLPACLRLLLLSWPWSSVEAFGCGPCLHRVCICGGTPPPQVAECHARRKRVAEGR